MAVGLLALTAYLLPGRGDPGAHWPLWNVQVYWWGGQQAVRGGALYAPGSPFSFTYPPFAALVFATAAGTSIGFLKTAITVASLVALALLCGQALGAAGLRRRPETVFAVTALSLLAWPVAYTLHLGEINLILAALIGADLLRRRGGRWWQGIGTGLAAGIKLTPLIFIAYLLATRRYRAAATAAGTFAATVAMGFVLLPSQSRMFWLDGVFYDQSRIGNTANPSNQSLAGVAARLAASTAAATAGWRRRSLGYGLAAVAVGVVFWGHIPMLPAGHPVSAGRLLTGDLYILCGLAVLAGTALLLTRKGRPQVMP
jgi:alpha-1,2-mannosyltransferase